MVKKSGTYRFYKQDHKIRFVDLRKIIKSDLEARRDINYANLNRIGSNLFIGGAYLLLTSSLCEKYIENKPVDLWVVSIATTCLLLASIPMRIAYVRHTRYAIETYNRNLKSKKFGSVEFKFGFTGNGAGFVVQL